MLLLGLPAIIYLFLFSYLPMFGVVIAFKDYNYIDGIWGSPWAGLEHFDYFFSSSDAARIIPNTIMYSLGFLFLKQILCIIVAILLYELSNRIYIKTYQTAILLPNFISWVLVAYIGFTLFSHQHGILNSIIESLGGARIEWYAEPKYWPAILTIFEMWKGVGMGCILYYAALMALDVSLFESAMLDGANRFQQIIHISIPSLMPTLIILLILGIGSIMGGDFGLFYQVPRNSGPLYPVTDIIATYTYRGLTSGNLSQSSAVGLFQSVCGMIMVITTNAITKKISPENSLF
ncbi:MAG: sugar ABC transporter permease [Clostridia bacterium]|nr:sugar ABC transporter permease [Clostridia bacterium]